LLVTTPNGATRTVTVTLLMNTTHTLAYTTHSTIPGQLTSIKHALDGVKDGRTDR